MRNSENISTTITWTIVCVAVFILQILGIVTIERFALLPAAVKSGQIYRILTGALMHANLQHIAANLISFVNVGSYCELKTGKKSFSYAIWLSMLLSGLFVTIFSNGYTVGFSGVVFGILGYFAVLLYKDDGQWDGSDLYLVGRMIVPNIIISFMPGVSLPGHAGGFIGGIIAGLLFIR